MDDFELFHLLCLLQKLNCIVSFALTKAGYLISSPITSHEFQTLVVPLKLTVAVSAAKGILVHALSVMNKTNLVLDPGLYRYVKQSYPNCDLTAML